jgi:excisionase family DNA binding protein
MTDDQYLTTDEVLGYLHVNLRTVYRMIKAGKLPAVRVGRQWRFRRRDIEAWLASNRTAGAALEAAHGPAQILVLDDEPSIRELVAHALAEYAVDTVEDGPTALERLRSGQYDLLITDLKMPRMDGLSVIREVRREWPDLPIVILTGQSTEASAIEAINLGVSGYVLKPFRAPRIQAVAARALGEPIPAEA